MSESKLKQAKKTHKTDFTYEDHSARADTKIDTPLGTFIVHNNGTLSDMANKLMWIQAPWGMDWNGNGFEGEPIKLNWHDATELFGRGGAIPSHNGSFNQKNAEKYVPNRYKRGRCEVTFLHRDWRLPTVMELFYLGVYKDAKMEGERERLRQTLFPILQTKHITFWSANDALGDYAWADDGSGISPLHANNTSKYSILLVRQF